MSKSIITVSRELGSGGRTIGKAVADILGCPLYDRELVAKIAGQSGLAESYVLDAGEYASSANSFLFSLALHGSSVQSNTLPVYDQLFVIQHNIIAGLADKGPCVIVGRCADYILRDRSDCLNVFIHADMEFRSHRLVELYGEQTDTPAKRLKDSDDKRRAYYRHYTGRTWGTATNYHLSLDSSVIGIERCASLIAEVARQV